MTQVDVPEHLHKRLVAMRPVIEAVLEEDVTLDHCIQTVLERGLDVMLGDLVGVAKSEILLASFQQLAARYPDEVYGYVADVLKTGAASIEREAAKRKFGFSAD